MAEITERYPLSVPGKYYISARCTDCDLCRAYAPNNITRDDCSGISYVFKQPTNDEEVAALEEGVRGCPTEAVGNDGDQFNWDTTPIIDWNAQYAKLGIHFDIRAPILPREQ
ncbi:MAG: ferredoxin [Limisphaerales bacterium]